MSQAQPVDVRFLSQEAAVDAGLVDMDGCVETTEHAFELYNAGQVVMGDPGQNIHGHVTSFSGDSEIAEGLEPGPDRRFSAMPAYVGGDVNMMGIKWYGSNITNPAKRGLPRSIHTITLNDPNSGQPLCVMDGQTASAMRTGAVAGVGAARVQSDRATTAAVIGPGVVGQTSALALDSALGALETIRVSHPELEKAEAFEAEMCGRVDAEVVATDSAETAVTGADVTVVAASGSPPPSIDGSWLGEDSLVIPLGDLRVSLDAFDADRVFCDIRQNCLEFANAVDWGVYNALGAAVEYGVGLDVDHSDLRALHEVVGGEDTDPTQGRSVLYSPGLPMEDVAWATEVYRNAEAADLGETVRLFEEPYFSKPY
jgi:ornithine cyclodeaminase